MPPSVRGIINDGVVGYDVSRAGGDYEGQEGVRNLLFVSISSLCNVALSGCRDSTV